MSRALIFTLVILVAIPVFAGTKAGVTMPDSIVIDNQTLVLNGMALRKKLIFKVYVAGLYIQQKEGDSNKILNADTMRSGAMHFLRSVDAGKIRDAWVDGLKANTPGFSAELKQQFDTLCSWMEAMRNGDRITFTYRPGMGTEIKVKNIGKGTIPGKAFADALFACWIGPKPGPGETFKKNLLGSN